MAIIGPGWQGHDAEGRSRINADNDWVRVEVETALQLDIPLLPVLVEGAEMPQPGDLPASLREMTEINALPISSASARFYDDLERLYTAIEKVTGAAPESNPPPVEETPPAAAEQVLPPKPAKRRAEAAEPAAAPVAAQPAAPRAPRAKAGPGLRLAAGNGRTVLLFFVLPAVVMSGFWALAFLTGSGGDGQQIVVFLVSAIAMVVLGAAIRQRSKLNIVMAVLAGVVVGAAATVTTVIAAEVNIERELWLVVLVFVGGGTVATVVGYVLGGANLVRRPPA